PGMRAVLTRTGDYFVPFRERIRRARVHQADLFVSVHADAFVNRSVRGSSVYVLSTRRASSEAARWLADRENAADLIGGVSLDDKGDVLASVLLDLSQNASISASREAATCVLEELDRVGQLKKSEVQHASLVVLTSPDVPSMLVETAFISNPEEERRLRDPNHQTRLAGAIHAGVRRFFHDNPPPGTLIATNAARERERLASGTIAQTPVSGT
ncbi:MAG: N-acetylmuramoyl-L-alanine amidase, partial [Steroidobacteraceae bacterium]